jgi:hypothetical protein
MAPRVFVGHDHVSDWIEDSVEDARDYDTYGIALAFIKRWPALIGWHDEIAVAHAIESILDAETADEIINQYRYSE